MVVHRRFLVCRRRQGGSKHFFERQRLCLAHGRSHDNECAAIAVAGRAFAEALTVESEIADAVRRLEADCNNFSVVADTP